MPMRHRLLSALLALTLAACATAPTPPAVSGSLPAVAVGDLEERALMLLLADRKTYEPVSINKSLDGDADLRRQVALTLGRIGDEQGGPVLEPLLADLRPEVRRAAAFALGELGEQGYRKGAQSLLGAMFDPDRETGRLAVEALAKLGVTLGSVAARLAAGGLAAEESEARLLTSLFRFQTAAGEPADAMVMRWAERGLENADPELRAMAAYALARRPKPGAATLLRPLLADADPWVRGWAARALGQLGDRSDLERLRPLLDDPAPGPIIQALRAVRRLIAAGEAAAPVAWKPRLLELLVDPRPGVRLTAIEVAAEWLLDDDLGAALASFATAGLRRERELALLALAEGEDPRAAVLVLRMAGDGDPVLRARAAEAAGLFRSSEVLERLAADADPGVRRTALETRLAMTAADGGADLARAALADPDPGVRAAALAWAVEHPVVPGETLYEAVVAARRDRIDDARLAAVRALSARAERPSPPSAGRSSPSSSSSPATASTWCAGRRRSPSASSTASPRRWARWGSANRSRSTARSSSAPARRAASRSSPSTGRSASSSPVPRRRSPASTSYSWRARASSTASPSTAWYPTS